MVRLYQVIKAQTIFKAASFRKEYLYHEFTSRAPTSRSQQYYMRSFPSASPSPSRPDQYLYQLKLKMPISFSQILFVLREFASIFSSFGEIENAYNQFLQRSTQVEKLKILPTFQQEKQSLLVLPTSHKPMTSKLHPRVGGA
ncbi:hypothetical protein CEXT_247181 [Caerostris extrusa]|uniref:Uncharacterized protein n=1 Tax=Caerostris extrusa TaxID=172846 RepID=A0AAV4WXE0_CAEEX|nr:hypothetical protein CEXT_247181 [Caerostris extrusa]